MAWIENLQKKSLDSDQPAPTDPSRYVFGDVLRPL